MEKNKISVTQQLAFADAVAYLEDLVQSLKAGRIVVEQGGEHVVLTTPEHVEVTVEAKAKKDRQKFALELEWYAAPAVESAAVTISAEAPASCCCAGTPESADAPASTVSTDSTDSTGTPQQTPAEENASSEACAAPESPASPEPRHIAPAQEEPARQPAAASALPDSAVSVPATAAPAKKPGQNAAKPQGKAAGKKTGKAGNRTAKKQPAGRRTS